MYTPRDLRQMEEFWLSKGEWFLVVILEGLALLALLGCFVLAGLGIVAAMEPPAPQSIEEAMRNLETALSVPLCFVGAGGVFPVVAGVAAFDDGAEVSG